MFFIPPTTLVVQDREGLLSYTQDDLIKYAGHERLIASAVVMRLFYEAFKDLSPLEPPYRDEIYIISSYPGKGVRDCIEMVTRSVTERRFEYLPDIAPESAPRTPIGGAMYFRVSYRGKAFSYTFSSDILNSKWCSEVIENQEGSASMEQHATYMNYKFKVVADLLTRPDAVLSTRLLDNQEGI